MCGSLISSIAYVMIFYFSGTGNSCWVAEQLSTAGAEELVAIADVYASDRRFVLHPDEKVGFVFPVYSWGPPSIVLQLIASVQFSEKPAYLYFVCTCGDDTGKTAEIFCKAVGRRGWKCQAGFSVIMPNTYVCLPGFDIDWRDVAETKCQEAEVRVAEIARLVAERVQRMDCYPGRFPALKSYLLRPLFNRFWSSPRRFRVEDTCVSCGRCEQVCPLHNIRLVDGKPVWGKECVACLACYHHCPKHAIAYGKYTRGKGQYTFPLR